MVIQQPGTKRPADTCREGQAGRSRLPPSAGSMPRAQVRTEPCPAPGPHDWMEETQKGTI
jgi:hypothetical protein